MFGFVEQKESSLDPPGHRRWKSASFFIIYRHQAGEQSPSSIIITRSKNTGASFFSLPSNSRDGQTFEFSCQKWNYIWTPFLKARQRKWCASHHFGTSCGMVIPKGLCSAPLFVNDLSRPPYSRGRHRPRPIIITINFFKRWMTIFSPITKFQNLHI